jgi:hypothetical protein
MRWFAFIVVAGLSMAQSAFAGDKPLTVQNCLDLNGALRALDGTYDYVVKEGNKETIAHRKYRLGNAWGAVALNLTALAPIVTAQEDMNKKVIAEIAGDGGAISRWRDVDHPEKGESKEFKEYMVRMNSFYERPCNIEFSTIKRSDLKIGDDNPIPFSIQSPLEAILE